MKDFKVAQIVPRSCLDLVKDNHYHMCLAHLVHEENEDRRWSVTTDYRYTSFYRRMSDEGKFVIMDNGAAENAQLGEYELLEMYELIRPTEIVVPDTLLDSADTLWKMSKFVAAHGDLPYRFMGVPQGKTLTEWIDCANVMMACPRINTIGISKFLNIATKNPWARLDAASAVQTFAKLSGRNDIEIHLLGCDEGPAIVKKIQQTIPMVRGCDSAFAYIAAKSGQPITADTKRPEGEIDFMHGDCVDGVVDRLHEMEQQCGVMCNTDGTLWRG